MAGTLVAFLVLLIGNSAGLHRATSTRSTQSFGGGTADDVIAAANAQAAAPDFGNLERDAPDDVRDPRAS